MWRAGRGRRARPRHCRRGCFRWQDAASGESPLGRKFYLMQMRVVRDAPSGLASLRVASDESRRTAGPYDQGHPDFMRGWWEWVSGSTPFFWNWPVRYAEEVRDGQPRFVQKDLEGLPRPPLPGSDLRRTRTCGWSGPRSSRCAKERLHCGGEGGQHLAVLLRPQGPG